MKPSSLSLNISGGFGWFSNLEAFTINKDKGKTNTGPISPKAQIYTPGWAPFFTKYRNSNTSASEEFTAWHTEGGHEFWVWGYKGTQCHQVRPPRWCQPKNFTLLWAMFRKPIFDPTHVTPFSTRREGGRGGRVGERGKEHNCLKMACFWITVHQNPQGKCNHIGKIALLLVQLDSCVQGILLGRAQNSYVNIKASKLEIFCQYTTAVFLTW